MTIFNNGDIEHKKENGHEYHVWLRSGNGFISICFMSEKKLHRKARLKAACIKACRLYGNHGIYSDMNGCEYMEHERGDRFYFKGGAT